MKNVLTIAKKELASLFNSPTAYIVAIAFVVPSYFLFWRSTLFSGEATMRNFFNLLPWFLLLIGPAMTMKSVSEEKRSQTIDLLLAHPLTEWQVIVGKFFGLWAFFGCLLLVTLSLPLTLSAYANLDWGEIAGQYVGGMLMGGAFIALGILVSAWFKNVVTSFIASAVLSFVWLLMGLDIVVLAVPAPFDQLIAEIGLLKHVDSLARGLISLQDVAYWLVAMALGMLLATVKVMEPKTSEHKQKQVQLYAGGVIMVAIAVLVHVALSSYPLRLDLTRDQRFSLSPATKTVIGNLPDIVDMTLYASGQLPGPAMITKRTTIDMVKDYARYGKGKVKFQEIDPASDPELSQQAAQRGVSQVQFNTIGSGRYEAAAGYLGLVIGYGGRYEAIPFIQNPDNLEYELTRRIKKLTNTDPKTIGVLSGHGEKSLFADMQGLNSELQSEYQVQPVSLPGPDSAILTDVLLVPGPSEAVSATASAAIKQYMNNGGKALFLLDKVAPNLQFYTASTLETGLENLLLEYGLTLNADLVYDVQLNESISLNQGFFNYIVPYTFWIRT
jgi:ABC-2 type transport system permease protein